MTKSTNRRLLVTVSSAACVSETQHRNRLGYWDTLSRTITPTFPLYLVARVPDSVGIVITPVADTERAK